MQIINCTTLISPNATDKNIIKYQFKPFKQQLDGMNNIYDSNNVFSVTSRICKVCIAIETQNLLSDPDFLITLPSLKPNKINYIFIIIYIVETI